jgi:hypothetical protein
VSSNDRPLPQEWLLAGQGQYERQKIERRKYIVDFIGLLTID